MELIFDEQGKCYSLVQEIKTQVTTDSFKMEKRDIDLTVSGQMASGNEIHIKQRAAEDTLLGSGLLGSLMPIAQAAKSLKVKEKVELTRKKLDALMATVIDEAITMERAADSTRKTQAGVILVKVFNIDVKRGDAHHKGVITLDKEHHLLEYERETQRGSFKFVRIE